MSLETPKEIWERRARSMNLGTLRCPFIRDLDPKPAVKKATIHHGTKMLDNALTIAIEAIDEIYSFKHGFRFTLASDMYIPKWIRTDPEQMQILSDCVQEIVTSLGWVVNPQIVGERLEMWVEPLSIHTPEENDAIIAEKVDRFAHYAVRVINEAMEQNQFSFTDEELQLNEVPFRLGDKVIARIRELLGAYWVFDIRNSSKPYLIYRK